MEQSKNRTGEEKEKNKSPRIPNNLLAHIEHIIELVENSKLNEEFYKKARRSINFVAKKMYLSENQVVLFAVFMERSSEKKISINEITKFMGCRNIKAVTMMVDAEELEKRRLIRCSREGKERTYRVPTDVTHAIKQNVVYEPESAKGLSTGELFKHIYCLFTEREEKVVSYIQLYQELQSLLEDNASLSFCRHIKSYKEIYTDYINFLLLLFFCHRYVNCDDDSISYYDYREIYDEKWIPARLKRELQMGDNKLITSNLIENESDYGFGDRVYFRLSTPAKEKLFEDLDMNVQRATNKKDLILYDSITPKELFFNEREQTQIQQLSTLLQQEDFLLVQNKLKENGMRLGFACLFHGAPGTGKTETVYQIARATGRNIIMVDIAESRSMWYGESEKRIKKIFDNYRGHLKASKIAPILLFNEADAIIGKRKDADTGTISRTENTIQNILLQEMENLEGIMIATTNLTQNLDNAFERRFLYKVEFEKPNIGAKAKIWNAMLPSLSEEERVELATNYDFSGGQIENIVRKYTVDTILNGTKPSLEAIHLHCQSELLYKSNGKRKIGYC